MRVEHIDDRVSFVAPGVICRNAHQDRALFAQNYGIYPVLRMNDARDRLILAERGERKAKRQNDCAKQFIFHRENLEVLKFM
jgi:hypothetical protein